MGIYNLLIKHIAAKLLIVMLLLVTTTTSIAKKVYIEKTIFGRREEIFIFADKLKLKAKLDTGAKTSSLSATNINEFEFDGRVWVSFKVQNPRTEEYIAKELPLERHSRIKQHKNGSSSYKSVKRPVVLIPVCLGATKKLIEINLVDRRHFTTPVLIGRDALVQFSGIIDPSREFTISPMCENMS